MCSWRKCDANFSAEGGTQLCEARQTNELPNDPSTYLLSQIVADAKAAMLLSMRAECNELRDRIAQIESSVAAKRIDHQRVSEEAQRLRAEAEELRTERNAFQTEVSALRDSV